MNGMSPRVSVVLPTFNRARTLPRAIATVLSQNVRDIELIIVDDASTDGTRELMSAQTDSRVRYVRQERNGGPAVARNTGIQLARGEYVAFQDSDDEWLPLKLEKQIASLQSAGDSAGLSICGQIRWDTSSICYLPQHSRTGARAGRLREEILHNNFALTPSWLVKREVFERIGPFDESLPMLEDWEWLIRYNEQHPAVLLDEPLMMVWESADSISLNQERYIRALSAIIEKHTAALASDRRSLSNLHYILGTKHALYADVGSARSSFSTAARLWPRDPRYWVASALALPGSTALFRRAWLGIRRAKGHSDPRRERLWTS